MSFVLMCQYLDSRCSDFDFLFLRAVRRAPLYALVHSRCQRQREFSHVTRVIKLPMEQHVEFRLRQQG